MILSSGIADSSGQGKGFGQVIRGLAWDAASKLPAIIIVAGLQAAFTRREDANGGG